MLIGSAWPYVQIPASGGAGWRLREGRDETPAPRLLDQVRAAIRARHYSRRTEAAYTHWVRRFVLFPGKRHPSEMGEPEITTFLTHLAVRGRVSASTTM